MNDNLTHVSVLMDRTGSMATIKSDAEGGVNQFVKDQKADKNGEVTMTVAQFDFYNNQFCYDMTYEPCPIEKIGKITISPRGATPLIDAMAKMVYDTGQYLGHMPEGDRPSTVICVIVTDGLENASKEHTKQQVNDMIRHQEDVYQWRFVFMGANQDAIAEAQNYGMKTHNAMKYAANSVGTRAAYHAVSSNVSKLRGMKSRGMEAHVVASCDFFEEEDRQAQQAAGVDKDDEGGGSD